MYRPYYYDRFSAGLDAEGRPVAWTHRIAGSSIMARYYPAGVKDGVDPDAVEAAAEPPYAFPAIRVDYVRVEPQGVPTSWRSEEHTSELQSLMRISYAVFCLKKKKSKINREASTSRTICRYTAHENK